MTLFNKLIAFLLPYIPKAIVRRVSAKYIAGDSLDDAVRVVRELNAKGAMATVDVLGEFITTLDEAAENTRYSCEVIERLHSEQLRGNLSIKLTSLALGLDNGVCEQNVRQILETAKRCGNMFVRFDMENSPYTTLTIDLYRTLRKEYSNCGVVLQAYLKRTLDDIKSLVTEGHAHGYSTNIRLCKGIYIESPAIMYTDRKQVQDNYLECLEYIFVNNVYAGIATHDDILIAGARGLIEKHHKEKNQFEFQMLLGVRDAKRDELIHHGYALRVYVPFGSRWYGYSLRRLKENPSMGGYIVKAMFTGD